MDNFIDKLAEKLNMQGGMPQGAPQGPSPGGFRTPPPAAQMPVQEPYADQSMSFGGGARSVTPPPQPQQPFPPSFTAAPAGNGIEELENEILQLSRFIKESDSRQIELLTELLRQNGAAQQETLQNMIAAAFRQSTSQQGTMLQQTITSAVESAFMSGGVVNREEPADSGELKELISAEKADIMKQLTQLEEHVHKENVKCYRNVQAVITEQSKSGGGQELDKTIKLIKTTTSVTVILLAVNVVLTILNLVGIF